MTIETSKEYANAWTQHDPTSFVSHSSTQTIPTPTVSLSIQTTPPPSTSASSTQTDVPIPRSMGEMEIQTDEPEPSRSPTPEAEDSMASSSTVQPPTPKGKAVALPEHPTDLPPSYHQVASDPMFHDLDHLLSDGDNSFDHITDPTARRDLRIAAEVLKKYHAGLHLPVKEVKAGVTEDAIEDWKALKEELGVECSVIDKLLEISPRTESSRSSSSKEPGGPTTKQVLQYLQHLRLRQTRQHRPLLSFLPIIRRDVSHIPRVNRDGRLGGDVGAHESVFESAVCCAWGGRHIMIGRRGRVLIRCMLVGRGSRMRGRQRFGIFLGGWGGGAARIARGWPT